MPAPLLLANSGQEGEGSSGSVPPCYPSVLSKIYGEHALGEMMEPFHGNGRWQVVVSSARAIDRMRDDLAIDLALAGDGPGAVGAYQGAERENFAAIHVETNFMELRASALDGSCIWEA